MVRLSSNWRRAVIRCGVILGSFLDRLLVRYSKVGNIPIIDKASFPWVDEMERNSIRIWHEVATILEQKEAIPPFRRISQDHDLIATDDKWRTFFLYGFGIPVEENIKRCPDTARILKKVGGLQTAMFSVLEPQARVPLHVGATKAVLTCHLGLQIPKDQCTIEIAGVQHRWHFGQLLVFDDMFPHQAKNLTNTARVVLFLHIKRPMKFPGALIRDAFLAVLRTSPYVRDARENIRDWNSSRY